MQDAKIAKKVAIGYIFATKGSIEKWEKRFKQHYLLHTSSQYGELRPTRG